MTSSLLQLVPSNPALSNQGCSRAVEQKSTRLLERHAWQGLQLQIALFNPRTTTRSLARLPHILHLLQMDGLEAHPTRQFAIAEEPPNGRRSPQGEGNHTQGQYTRTRLAQDLTAVVGAALGLPYAMLQDMSKPHQVSDQPHLASEIR